MRLLAALLPVALVGCASFHTTQIDERTNPKTGEKTTITTRASAITFFDSRSALSQFKATQTEKSQGASVGALIQDAASMNVVGLAEAIAKGAAEGAVKAAIPKVP